MPKFSKRSKQRLYTCDADLIVLFEEVVKVYDCTIIQGYRGKALQNRYFSEGKSKLRYPDSKHNSTDDEGKPCSLAVDVAPYPVDFKDLKRYHHFAGFVLATYHYLVKTGECYSGWRLRWGGNWSEKLADMKTNRFEDLGHFEMVPDK